MVSGALVSVLSCSNGFSWPEKKKTTTKHKMRSDRRDDGWVESIQILLLLHCKKQPHETITKMRLFKAEFVPTKTWATLKLVPWERDSNWMGKLSNKTTLRPDCCWRGVYSHRCYSHAHTTTAYQTPGNTHLFFFSHRHTEQLQRWVI